jgi:hypothetical protein
VYNFCGNLFKRSLNNIMGRTTIFGYRSRSVGEGEYPGLFL